MQLCSRTTRTVGSLLQCVTFIDTGEKFQICEELPRDHVFKTSMYLLDGLDDAWGQVFDPVNKWLTYASTDLKSEYASSIVAWNRLINRGSAIIGNEDVHEWDLKLVEEDDFYTDLSDTLQIAISSFVKRHHVLESINDFLVEEFKANRLDIDILDNDIFDDPFELNEKDLMDYLVICILMKSLAPIFGEYRYVLWQQNQRLTYPWIPLHRCVETIVETKAGDFCTKLKAMMKTKITMRPGILTEHVEEALEYKLAEFLMFHTMQFNPYRETDGIVYHLRKLYVDSDK